jgi:hypothetical protein
MKTLTLILSTVVILSSCSKDYSCQCITKDKVYTETKNYPYKHLAKSEAAKAKSNCEALNKNEAGVDVTCKLIKD